MKENQRRVCAFNRKSFLTNVFGMQKVFKANRLIQFVQDVFLLLRGEIRMIQKHLFVFETLRNKVSGALAQLSATRISRVLHQTKLRGRYSNSLKIRIAL